VIRPVTGGTVPQGAVCIVGSGAAGIALARAYARASEKLVVVLESGDARVVRDDPRLDSESVGLGHQGATHGRARALGGATRLWAGQLVRLEREDFERREWVPHSGWPFGRDQLEAYYRRAEAFFGITGEPDDERVWERFGVPSPMGEVRDFTARFTVFCPEPDLYALYGRELAASEGIVVLTGATATRALLEPGSDRVAGIEVRDDAGERHVVTAEAYVLACGGIENPRLLLASNPGGTAPGNLRDCLGRYFQEHPNAFPAEIETPRPRSLQETFSLFYGTGRRYLPRMLVRPEVQERERTMTAAINPVYDFGDIGTGALRALRRQARRGERPTARLVSHALLGLPDTSRTAFRRFVRGRSPLTPPERIRLQVHSEQAPNPDSRITLSDRRDRAGERIARIDWRLTDLDYRTILTTARLTGDALRSSGLGALREPVRRDADGLDVSDSYHHIGATRMSADPATRVVDPHCRVDGMANLYVAGSSVFPTGGFGNPTLTLVALAERLADDLVRA
jgi:choline dehydrogenase-like flavoprotein